MPTALFAVWLLGQYLTPMQWASLPVLAVGVVLVTMNGSTGKHCLMSAPVVLHLQANWPAQVGHTVRCLHATSTRSHSQCGLGLAAAVHAILARLQS